jgi:hypothetical protein
MSNLPGLEFGQHIVETLSSAWTKQLQQWNKSWTAIESGTYDFKQALADWAKCYRLQFDAARDVATFEIRSVEWQYVRIAPGQATTNVQFEISVKVDSDDVKVATATLLGMQAAGRGTVRVTKEGPVVGGFLTLKVDASADTQVGDQWIAFAIEDASSAPPLGVVLVEIVAK